MCNHGKNKGDCFSFPLRVVSETQSKAVSAHGHVRLLHELARDVEQATDATGASSSSTAATSLALQVELKCHLSCLSDSILLGSSRVLEIVSLCPFNTVSSTYSLALRLLLIKQLRSLCHGHSD
jgi:hypothetical protein